MQCVWIPVERHAQPLKLLVKNENVIYSNSIYPCPTIYIHNHLINQEHIKVLYHLRFLHASMALATLVDPLST